MATSSAAILLRRQLKQMQADKDIPGISCGLVDDNIFEWQIVLMLNDDCKYYGGMFSMCKCWYHHPLTVGRWFLQSTAIVSSRVPSNAAQDEVRNTHLPPERLPVR